MRRDIVRLVRQSVVLTLALGFASCTDDYSPMQPSLTASYVTPTGLVTANPPQIFTGAGDISSCSNTGDEATAKLLDAIPEGNVYNLGDDAYNNGTDAEFACYHATWGRHKGRTKPSAGNHEYNTSGATGYYKYFGAAAGDPTKGYYSFNLGLWHIIVLNSNITRSTGSAQDTWLAADLAAHPNQCTLSYWHHPLYSSGSSAGGQSIASMKPFWDRLYAAHADLVLNGHRHFYDRMAPMKPDGTADPVNGIREIVAGMGGIGGGNVSGAFPTSEVRNGSTFGVLKFYLYDDSYAWKFIPVAGKTFTDSGSTACHSSGGGGGGPVISAANSSVLASPASFTAGSGSSTITVTARDGNNATMSGATVSLSSSGSGNLFTPASGTTNGSGVFTSVLTSTVAQDKIVSATINTVAISQKDTVTVTPAADAALVFTAQPTNTAANAPITPAVVVEVRDAYGNRTSSSAIVAMDFGANPGSGTLAGTLSQNASNGVATFSDLKINNIASGYTLVASIAGPISVPSNLFNITTPVPSATNSTVSAVTPSFTAGGSSQINVVVKDGLGNAMSGITVTLSSSVSGDVITQPADTTDASGATSGTVAATAAGLHKITATAGTTNLNQKPDLTVSAGSPDAGQSSFTASPLTITQTTGSSNLTVTVRDQYGNPVSGSAVSFSASPSTGVGFGGGGSTNTSGVATGTMTSSVAEVKTLTALAGILSITQTQNVTVTPPSVGITQALLTAGSDVTNQKIYTTGSIAYAANALVTIAVIGHTSTAASASPTITGAGLTWVEVTTTTFNSTATPLKRMSIFRAMSPSAGSGPLTISFPTTESNAAWIVSQWTGVDQTGTNGSGAVGTIATPSRSDAATSISATLAALSSPNSAAYGVVGTNGSALGITPGGSFAEISEQKPPEGTNTIIEALFAANQTVPAASWTGSFAAAILAIEIKAGP